MIATGEFDIFHLCSSSFQCFVRFTRPFNCYHIIGIPMKYTELHFFGNRQTIRLHRSANGNGSRKNLRITDHQIIRPHRWYVRDWMQYDAVKNNGADIEQLREGLEEAVRRLVISDVPYKPSSYLPDIEEQVRKPDISLC